MLRTLQLLSNDRSYANDDTIDKHIAEFAVDYQIFESEVSFSIFVSSSVISA